MQIERRSAEMIPIAAVRVLGNDAIQSLGCVLRWYREEKPCVHPGTIRFGFCSKRIAVDDLAKLLVGSYQQTNRRARMLLERGCNQLGHRRCRALCIENRIAALDISLDVLESKFLQQLSKIGHRQLAVSTHIYGAKKDDIRRHEASPSPCGDGVSVMLGGGINISVRWSVESNLRSP